MRIGDRYRWTRGDGGLWLDNHVYEIVSQMDENVFRITTQRGATAAVSVEDGAFQLVVDEEKYIAVGRRPDESVFLYVGYPNNDGFDPRVFPDVNTAIDRVAETSTFAPDVEYYLIPVRGVRRIVNGSLVELQPNQDNGDF